MTRSVLYLIILALIFALVCENNATSELEQFDANHLLQVFDGPQNYDDDVDDIHEKEIEQHEDLAYEATRQLGQLNYRMNLLTLEEESRQIQLPNVTLPNFIPSIPCNCVEGICNCCAGFLSVFGLRSCMEIVYRPDEFSFEVRMKVNENVLFRRKVSGQNPPPFCIRPPRFNFARACLQFHDIWFVGRNMHVCMHMSGSFQGYELFERSFDCLLFGDSGVKIVKPEQGYPVRPNDVEIDNGDDDIEDYDENLIRRSYT